MNLGDCLTFSETSKTGVFFDQSFVEHNRVGHPEDPTRLLALCSEVDKNLKDTKLRRLKFEFDDWKSDTIWLDALSSIHDRGYLKTLLEKIDRPEFLSPARWSPYGGPHAREATFKAAVGTGEVALAIARNEIENGFAIVRPPGHHAGSSFSGGYCLVNNAAYAAQTVANRYQKPVALLDLDVHHGNGSQDIFYESSDVSFISIHQDEWPHTGDSAKTGAGPGKGSNFNLPLPLGADGDIWLRAFDNFAVPATSRTAPFMLIVSMGYDGHWRDPQGSMQLSCADLLSLTSRARNLANKLCDGRILFVLEGGYDRRATAAGILNTLADLFNSKEELLLDPYGAAPITDDTRALASRIRQQGDQALANALKNHAL